MNRTWEAVQLSPVAKNYSEAVVGHGEHCPFVTDILDKLVPLAYDAQNVALSIVQDEYRVLSYSVDNVPHVFAIIAFDRRG